MRCFWYQAKNLEGMRFHGRVDADSRREAYEQIRNLGLFVVRLEQSGLPRFNRHLEERSLADLCRQLGILLEAGIPLLGAFCILAEKAPKRADAKLYQGICRLLSHGNHLSEAMQVQGEVFPLLLVNMVRAGELGGRLGTVCLQMADYYEKEARMKSRIRGALVYPVFLAVLALVSLVVVFTGILPELFVLFETSGELPESTRLLLWVSGVLSRQGKETVLVVLSGFLLLCGVGRLPQVRLLLDRMKLSLPGSGVWMRTICTARFARTLSFLYGNGILLTEALPLASGVVGNAWLERKLEQVLCEVKGGRMLSAAVGQIKEFDPKLSLNLLIGEESGNLRVMLEPLADRFDFEADEAAKRLTVLIEPVLLVGMAVLAGGILWSVMVPIYQYYQGLMG